VGADQHIETELQTRILLDDLQSLTRQACRGPAGRARSLVRARWLTEPGRNASVVWSVVGSRPGDDTRGEEIQGCRNEPGN